MMKDVGTHEHVAGFEEVESDILKRQTSLFTILKSVDIMHQFIFCAVQLSSHTITCVLSRSFPREETNIEAIYSAFRTALPLHEYGILVSWHSM